MKKNLLLLLALTAGAFTMWSQEPSYQSSETSPVKSQKMDMPALHMPDALYIAGVECRLDKHLLSENKMEEYVYDGNSIVCTRYEYDWSINDWRPISKSNTVYNQEGLLTLFETYTLPSYTDQWVGSNKFEYGYDQGGRTILKARYRWSESRNDWYCETREERLFSDSGQKLFMALWTGNPTSAVLMGKSKIESTLYENDKVKENINYAWDESTNDWVIDNKETFTYNQHGFTSGRNVYKLNAASGSWEQSNGTQYVYQYDRRGKKTSIIENEWNPATAEWNPKYITTFGYDLRGRNVSRVKAEASAEDPLQGFEKDEYEYNDLNQVVLHQAQLWEPETNQWWTSFRDEYSYDEFRNVNSFTRYKWMAGNPECFGWQKWERAYTDERQITMKADYKWDTASKAWTGKERKLLTKDDLGLNLDVAENYIWTQDGWLKDSYEIVEFNPENFVATITRYDSNSDKAISQEYFYYSPIGTTGIANVLNQDKAQFTIEGNCITTSDDSRITIYSIDGKLVNTSVGKVEAPTSGFYIVKVGDKASKVYVK